MLQVALLQSCTLPQEAWRCGRRVIFSAAGQWLSLRERVFRPHSTAGKSCWCCAVSPDTDGVLGTPVPPLQMRPRGTKH